MLKVWWRIKRRKISGDAGFSPIEVLLAATVLGFMVVALIGAFIYGRVSTQDSGNRAAATMLADEGVQALRNMRNGAYANLTDGTFGLAQTGGVWTLSGASDTSGIFTRQVAIASNGTSRKTVTSTVSWNQGGNTKQVSVVSMLSNWLAAIKSWANGVIAGSNNLITISNAVKVATVGDYSFTILAATSSNFVVADISNPAAPTIARTVSVTGTPTNIVVVGNYAYVTTNSTSGEVAIVDIANPTNPIVRTPYNAPGTAGGLGIFNVGNLLYVTRAASTTDNEFLILSLANPLVPALTGSYNNNIAMNEVYVSGNYAYVAISSLLAPMLIINVGTPSSPTLSSSFGLSLLSNSLTIKGSGNYVYLGSGTTLTSINVTNPVLPSVAGQLVAAGSINDIDLDDAGNVFLGTSSTSAEFQVVNATNPASMSIIRSIDVSGTASTVGGVAYNTSLDVVAGASYSNTQEILVFRKN